jgi:two-component system CheB/CheR fusion protein
MQEPKSTLIPERVFDSSGDLPARHSPDILFPVAAIGLAAGGMEAVAQLLKKLPSSLGMIYIIIQSGPPDQEEILPDRLAEYTGMKVHSVKEELLLERDQVYILPPDTYMCVNGKKLVHFPRARTEGGYHTIDFFFAALATACRERVIGILLSGVTADGAAGFRAIRAEGGITIAQDDSARFRGMPHNAISSGYTDLVLSPEQIATEFATLNKYIPPVAGADQLRSSNKREITGIYLFLLEKFKLDFSLYSPVTVCRRILRRMRLGRVPDLESYTRLLQDDDREADLLHRDLLLYVTGFFRQPEIYQALTKNILPALLKNRKPAETLRLWIPACYNGEEAWSVAIVLQEYWRENRIGIPIQLFATDMSAAAIQKARTGLYSKIILQNVSNRRLKEYFTKTEGGYRVVKPIRDLCVFAVQDLLCDPPFSNMDIICCENRMVSLEPGPREKVTRAFHYALKPSGSLLLGRFETIGLPADLFTPSVDNRCSFVKKEMKAPRRDFFLGDPSHMAAGKNDPARAMRDTDPGKEADALLLSRYVPPTILVDKELQILRFYGNTAPYCRPSSGKATLSLFKIVRDELIFELENLLERVKKYQQVAIKDGILLPELASGSGTMREITLEVIPVLSGQQEGRLLILFRETNRAVSDSHPDSHPEKGHFPEMENDLRAARQQLLTMSEAFERKQDELRFAYEESMSLNEELQSRNEQLEDSKEEWRSSGEELIKINKELHARSDEWKESAQYARAVVDNIAEPIMVLNGNGRVHSANRALYEVFRIRPGQVEGRYLHEVDHELFNIGELEFRLQTILQKKTAEAELEWKGSFFGLGEKIFIFRLKRIIGGPSSHILLTLEDITRRRIAEKRKDEFIGIASHELKTPVTSIQAYSQILYSELLEANDQKSAQLVNKLVNQVTRLTRMTKDLLDLTSISEGQLRLKGDYFDLNLLVDEIIEEMQRTTEHRIVKNDRQPLPEIWADRERMAQVLTNLIANAIKYSPGADQVQVSTFAGTGRVYLAVRDFGAGIPEEIRDKIFDRFFRADYFAHAHSPGLGLGLYISYEIVRQHGGVITVDSEDNKGSVFTVDLPLKAPNR